MTETEIQSLKAKAEQARDAPCRYSPVSSAVCRRGGQTCYVLHTVELEPDAILRLLALAQLLVDLQAEWPRATRDECAKCQDCGPMVMCDKHSFLSALHRGTITSVALEREQGPT